MIWNKRPFLKEDKRISQKNIDRCDYIKIKDISSWKDTIKRGKGKTHCGLVILTTHVTDKGFIT